MLDGTQSSLEERLKQAEEAVNMLQSLAAEAPQLRLDKARQDLEGERHGCGKTPWIRPAGRWRLPWKCRPECLLWLNMRWLHPTIYTHYCGKSMRTGSKQPKVWQLQTA